LRLLFLLSHPAHFHLFKNIIEAFRKNGHNVLVLIRPKDVLEELVKSCGLDYIKIAEKERRPGRAAMVLSLLGKEVKIMNIARKYRPDFLIGSDAALAHVGFLMRIPSFEFCEDDEKVIKLYANVAFPFFTKIIAPVNCSLGRWESKKISYNGYHESAFLTPEYFQPDESIPLKYGIRRPYSIIRFSGLGAYHDKGIGGIDNKTALKIIDHLSHSHSIYITSEKPLRGDYEPYRLRIDSLDIHHILYYSDILVSDSQSMSMEAAVLGTPSVRISGFAGRISVLEELEHKYGLTWGILPEEAGDKVIGLIDSILQLNNEDKYFEKRRGIMLNEKADLVTFVVSYFENYHLHG
jgi:uncharacterized protein